MLVDMQTKEAHKGSEALRYLERLATSRDEPEPEPTQDAFGGVLPGGEQFLHETNSNFEAGATGEPAVMTRDDKVTDADLEAYMKARG